MESYNIVKEIDCFDAVYSAGIQPFKTLVQNNWNITEDKKSEDWGGIYERR